jgi:hypothetical protein
MGFVSYRIEVDVLPVMNFLFLLSHDGLITIDVFIYSICPYRNNNILPT